MRLGIGTAQFGLNYGITNSTGKVQPYEVEKIITAAHEMGIRDIDTSPAYGVAESIIGQHPLHNKFKTVIKTVKLENEDFSKAIVRRVVDEVEKSLSRLKIDSCHGLIIHDVRDLKKKNFQALADALLDLKIAGKVDNIGISAYGTVDIDIARKCLDLDIIQIPLSAFNQELAATGYLKALKSDGVEIHARSIFLQGILLATKKQLPLHLKSLASKIRLFNQYAELYQMSKVQLALEYIRQTGIIDVAVVGVTSLDELFELSMLHTKDTPAIDWELFRVQDKALVNPNCWNV